MVAVKLRFPQNASISIVLQPLL